MLMEANQQVLQRNGSSQSLFFWIEMKSYCVHLSSCLPMSFRVMSCHVMSCRVMSMIHVVWHTFTNVP